MLCCPQDVNTNKSFPVQFCPLPLMLANFPQRHRCYAFSEQVYYSSFSKQNHNQTTTALNWAKLDTFQAFEVFFAAVVD